MPFGSSTWGRGGQHGVRGLNGGSSAAWAGVHLSALVPRFAWTPSNRDQVCAYPTLCVFGFIPLTRLAQSPDDTQNSLTNMPTPQSHTTQFLPLSHRARHSHQTNLQPHCPPRNTQMGGRWATIQTNTLWGAPLRASLLVTRGVQTPFFR